MRKECTLEWVDDNGNVIPNNIIKLPKDVVKEHIDVIEVVLCKDCRHAGECHKSVQYTRNEQNTVTIGYSPIEWCSRGERREE